MTADIIKYLIKKAAESGKSNVGGGGGDACCGGDEPEAPDAAVLGQIPKLTETLLEILAEKPINDPTIKLESGTTFKYKSEALLTTLLAFTLKVIGGSNDECRKLSCDVLKSHGLEVQVIATKIPGIIIDEHTARRRTYMALVDLSNNQMQMMEISTGAGQVLNTFKVAATTESEGKRSFRAYIVTGNGQIQKSSDITA